MFDLPIGINLLGTKHKSIVAFLKLITHTSSGLVYLIYTLVIPLIFPYKGISIVKMGIIAFAFQIPIYIFIKNLVKRDRPSDAIKEIKQIVNPPDKYSIPSGRTSNCRKRISGSFHHI